MDESRIVYRRATVWDAYAIADMWELEMNEMKMSGRHCDSIEKEKFLIGTLIRINDKTGTKFVLVAEHNKRIISFITGGVTLKEFGTSKVIGYCEHRYTYTKYRSKGVSSKLLNHLIDILIKQKAKELEFITKYDERLVKIYKKMGYEPYSIHYRKEVNHG